MAVGVDGCRVGWIAALAYSSTANAPLWTELRLLRQEDGGLASLVGDCEAMNERPALAVDVPTGLPTTAGLRDCDREADQLGRRWIIVSRFRERQSGAGTGAGRF